MRIKKLFKDNSLLLAISITILIALLSLLKLGKQPIQIQIENIDKLEHCIAYFVLTLFWLIALHKKVKVILIALVCLLYGIILEVLQGVVTTYRFVEYYDIVANSIGILIALLVFRYFIRKSKLFKGAGL